MYYYYRYPALRNLFYIASILFPNTTNLLILFVIYQDCCSSILSMVNCYFYLNIYPYFAFFNLELFPPTYFSVFGTLLQLFILPYIICYYSVTCFFFVFCYIHLVQSYYYLLAVKLLTPSHSHSFFIVIYLFHYSCIYFYYSLQCIVPLDYCIYQYQICLATSFTKSIIA